MGILHHPLVRVASLYGEAEISLDNMGKACATPTPMTRHLITRLRKAILWLSPHSPHSYHRDIRWF